MSLDPLIVVELLALGAFTGLMAGMFGIGGSMLMVPFMIWLMERLGVSPDWQVQAAIGTALATICFSSLSSVRAHHKRGAVRWPVVFGLSPGILLGSYLGAWIATQLNRRALAIVFGIFVCFSAWQMIVNRKPKPSRELPGRAGMVAAGGGIGVLSGLLGAGGGFVSVPFMVWCNVPIQNAVATSAALGFPIAIAGTASYIINGWNLQGMPAGFMGFLYLPAVVVISIASVSTAPIGARIAHGMDTTSLKRAFASVLLVLGGTMLWRGVM